MKTRLLVLSAAVLVIFVSQAAALESPGAKEPLLWRDSSHTWVEFLSGDPLNQLLGDSSGVAGPVPSDQARIITMGLDSMLRETKASTVKPHGCLSFQTGFGISVSGSTAPHSESLATLIHDTEFAVVATVERTVPGVITTPFTIGTRTWVRIVRILNDSTGSLQVDTFLSYLHSGGSLVYKGISLCTDSRGVPPPTVGEELLLIGTRAPVPGIVYAPWTLAIKSGSIVPNQEAFPLLTLDAPKPLADLQRELENGGRQ